MRDLKYIIIAIGNSLEPRAIVFNGMFNHSDIWLGARKSLPSYARLSSAGFCRLQPINNITIIAEVYGGSESLTKLLKREIKSLSTDSAVIEATINRKHLL